MKSELSILIPAYNYPCKELVEHLAAQASAIPELRCEIIVAEDGSTDAGALAVNGAIASMPGCIYLPRPENVGRAAIRNILAQESHYEWLLFLDCDMQPPHNHFVSNYIEHMKQCPSAEVIDGGFRVTEQPQLMGHNLRYTYEWTEQSRHSAPERQQHPYRSFRTTNFAIRRKLMTAHPFDERFVHYGYEDVIFGKELQRSGIGITHIDNPMMLTDNEPNPRFVEKTEESLRTLHDFHNELRGYSRLLTFVDGIHLGAVRSLLRLHHRLFGPLERRNLCGQHPRLNVFKLYKLGYYLTLTKNH